GSLIFAKARSEEGKIHNPSPHINPEATAGTIKLALLSLNLCHRYTTRDPTHMSMAK
ncbi:hypothetical protein LINPERHAP2_LOCUS41496, partial [Linum perenne]